jgi:transitional endoplasmic reticulum ATPase
MLPNDQLSSAWAFSHRRPARLITGLADKLGFACLFCSSLAWWGPLYWVTVAILPFDWSRQSTPFMRNFIAASLIASFAVILFGYWLELQTLKPRAAKGLPLVGSGSTYLAFGAWPTYGLGMPALSFGGLLLLAAAMQSHGSATHNDNLWYGVGMVCLGMLSLYWGKHPPKFGLNELPQPAGRPAQFNPQAEEEIKSSLMAEQGSAPIKGSNEAAQSEDYATPVHAAAPKINFSHIFGMHSVKDKLLEPGQLIVAERTMRAGTESPANGVLLFGEPGNGKTVFAEALAGELRVPIIQLTYGDVSSKWLGEMPRLISNCFAYAKLQAPCVFFIDEIDSFIRSRDAAGSNEESLKITNTLLTEIVNLRNFRVVLVGATNYLANLDAAAIREGRFDYKVEITPPDEEARIGIIGKGVAKHAQHLNVDRQVMLSVAKRWNGFSVSRLLAVVKALPRYAKDNHLTDIGHAQWMGALREVQGRSGRVPTDTKSLAELILDAPTREALNMVVSRLKDVERIESLGGTLPSGVLFFGPSGTGKTAAARALAKEVGWAFLSVSGPDLIADRERISKVYTEAKDIRPTLIFIDEADDALRNRQYSTTPDLTNRMLVLMDGTQEKVKDVVFIAATNHPDQIDPALLRAGRFTEKVEFTAPPTDQIPRYVSAWLKGKSVILEPGLDAWVIADLLEGQTIATIEGVLQYALNRSISLQLGQQTLVMTPEDLEAGMRIVLIETQAVEL